MVDDRRRRKAAICTAPSGRYIVAKLGQALDMGLVDDRVLPGDRGSAFFPPGEGFVDDYALGHSTRIVPPVEREVAVPDILCAFWQRDALDLTATMAVE